MATPKRLTRNPTDRVLLGVCSGIADYMSIDPVVVRVLYVLFSVFTGFFPGIIAYLVLTLVMPKRIPMV